jgi:replicative DNA helicase
MATLTARAERALLGAMLANPAVCSKVRQIVEPGDFHVPWHQRLFQVVVAVSEKGPRDPAGLRAAITRADPSLTRFDLDQLVEDCPNPDHSAAYASMLVFGYSQRYLADRGRELAARAGQLDRDAGILHRTDEAVGNEIAAAAIHLRKLGNALRAHAATMVPDTNGPSIPALRHPATEQARREELVLAALAHLKPADAEEIRWVMRPEAITDPYRRAVLEVVSDMACDGRPIDELTLDWAIAERGLPLRPRGGGATIGERLAHMPVSLQEGLMAARELQAQQERAGRGPAAGLQQQGKPGSRRVTGTRTQGHPVDGQLAPILRLRPGGPRMDGHDHGPQPR